MMKKRYAVVGVSNRAYSMFLDGSLKRQAGLRDGICAVLTGTALYEAARTGQPVHLERMWKEVCGNAQTRAVSVM